MKLTNQLNCCLLVNYSNWTAAKGPGFSSFCFPRTLSSGHPQTCLVNLLLLPESCSQLAEWLRWDTEGAFHPEEVRLLQRGMKAGGGGVKPSVVGSSVFQLIFQHSVHPDLIAFQTRNKHKAALGYNEKISLPGFLAPADPKGSRITG